MKKIIFVFVFFVINFTLFAFENKNLIEFDKIKAKQDFIFEENKKMQLKDILEYTFNNNDTLNAEREKTKAIKTEKTQIFGGNALPNVGIELDYGWTDFDQRMGAFNLADDGETKGGKIYLQQPIFKSGRTTMQIKMVNNKIEMQKNQLMDVEQEVLFNTINATLNLLQAKEILAITIKNEESLKKSYDYVVARRKVGRETLANVSLAKARYSSAKTDTILANTQYLNAKANFSRITKINTELVDVDYEKIFEDCFKYDIVFDDVLYSALNKNPKYQMAKNNYEMNRSNLKLAKTNFLPELYLNAQISKSDTTDLIRNKDKSVGLVVKIPLFQSGTEYAKHKQASYSLNQSKFNLNDVRDVLINQCVSTFDEFISSKSIVLSSKAYRDAAKLALENTFAEERIGRATLVDLLDRRKEYFDTEIAYLQYKLNVIKYYYSLKVLMGNLTIQNLFG